LGQILDRELQKPLSEVGVKTTAALLSGVAFGAAINYIADRKLGKRRRAIARNTAVHLGKIIGRAVNISMRDARNRLKGLFEETKRFAKRGSIDDQILEDRVRTAVGRVSSHPKVEVIVEGGCVTLLGPGVNRG